MGCARNEAIRFPSAACANAVVMPHVGQGMSANAIQPHGGNLSWEWVPNPVAEGVIQAAMPNTPAQRSATTPATARRVPSPLAVEPAGNTAASAPPGVGGDSIGILDTVLRAGSAGNPLSRGLIWRSWTIRPPRSGGSRWVTADHELIGKEDAKA